MGSRMRGLFPLEPPAGGMERLRRAMRELERPRWQTVMPWAATACLLLLVGAPLLVGEVRAMLAGHAAVDQIVQSVRAQEPEPWTALPPGRRDVQVYLAVSSGVEETVE